MIARWWLLLLTVGTFASSSSACDAPAWRRAIERYLDAHPKAEAADLYKFAHQGILGSEHAVTDTVSAHEWMRREVATLPMRARAPVDTSMVEPLAPDGRFVRVHLRSFIAVGGDPASLVRAFMATANGARGDTAQFACVERALSTMEPQRVVTPLARLIGERRHRGFDAVHHSTTYEAAYAPAYRVIRASLLESLSVKADHPASRREVDAERLNNSIQYRD